jgi:hypothetical protein
MINDIPCYNIQTGSGARHHLEYFHGESEADWDFYDGLSPHELANYGHLPQYDRAMLESSVFNPIPEYRDVPDTETLFYGPPHGIHAVQRSITIASIQPAHRMSETVERSDILFFDGRRGYGIDWEHRHELIRRRPVIIAREGEFLIGMNRAQSLALDGVPCVLIDAGRDAPYADWGWENALRRHELIRP